MTSTDEKVFNSICLYDKILFIDESGNEGINHLDKENVSNFYVVGALIANSAQVKRLEEFFKQTKEDCFQNEMKSKHVGKNLKRRIKILRKLFSISDYTVNILIVDKRKLSGGFKYSKSFVKNIQLKLYSSFKGQLCDILIVSDKIKRTAFNDEFERYIYNNLESTLWARREKLTVNSEDLHCVQAVDFIVGSVLRGLENPSEHSAISKDISKDIVSLSYFPEVKPTFLFDVGTLENEEYNREIAEEAFSIANRHVQDNRDSMDESDMIRVQCLWRLINEYSFGDKKKWVQSDELLSYVNSNCGFSKSKDSLRYHIGKLKEDGVLIASRSGGGYKLPCCINDLELFINNMGSKIVPMIDRMKKARDIIKKSSVNNFDILEDKPIYKELITAYEEVKAQQIVLDA